VLQRAHVVQAVGQLDQHHADVVHHGQDHLADALGLGFFARGKIDFADLGDALDDVCHLFAELRANVVNRDRGVFHGVVQQAGGDGGGVETHVGQHGRHFQRVHQVRLARGAGLALVMAEGEVVGLLNQSKIVVWAVGANFAQKIAKAGDGQDVGGDLLAESRHVRLYGIPGHALTATEVARVELDELQTNAKFIWF
jgi:hypothetical protein